MKYYYTVLFLISSFIAPLTTAQTTTFNYTGAMQTYVVPAGVTSLDIDMSGARGGYGTSSVNSGGPNIPGFGGRVQTTLDVTPGQTLYIYVGGVGSDGVGGSVFNAGGFNGGGDGYRWASAGGGASDIRIGGTTLNDRVIVAGGGGGYGDNSFSGDFGGNGGDLTAANGESGGDPNGLGVGFGGDQSSGGAGGQYSVSYGVAGSGQLGLGGDAYGDADGGGGGAGYYGGGAGSYSGGGGGSSYADAALTSSTIHTQGFKNGAGEVIITENCSTIPVADATLSDLTDECSVAAPTAPTATSCTGTYSGTPDVSFPITAAGTTVVTWTYDDGNGNTSSQTQNVIIVPIDNGITQVNATTLTADASGYNYQWVDCDNSNAPINGETGQTFVATTGGNYAVEIDNGNCTVVSSCIQLTIGLEEKEAAESISLYPNPTNSTVILNNQEGTVKSMTIINALGQEINTIEQLPATEFKVNLPEERGIYLFIITTENNQKTYKRVIKN